jgi:hypothetical protein
MRINGYGLRDHIRLLAPLFGLLTAVWALRMVLATAGAPLWLVEIVSVTGATAASVLLAVLLMYVKRFGGYANVVLASFLLNTWAEILIIAAILFSVWTGTENVYTAPEFSIPGDDTLHLKHIYGHLTFGIGMASLFGAGVGCLLLWLLRTLVPAKRPGTGVGSRARG